MKPISIVQAALLVIDTAATFTIAPPSRGNLLYVHSHGEASTLRRNAAILGFSKNMWLVTNFSLLIVESHRGATLEETREAAAAFPHTRAKVVLLPAKDDHQCGHFIALNASSELWRSFDLVLHINADTVLTPAANVFLRAHVEDTHHADAAFLVTGWRGHTNAYNTDTFLFRPPLLPLDDKNFFGDVCNCHEFPIRTNTTSSIERRCVAESMIYNKIRRSTKPLAVYDMGRIDRKTKPDKLGIWHTHNSEAVAAWMASIANASRYPALDKSQAASSASPFAVPAPPAVTPFVRVLGSSSKDTQSEQLAPELVQVSGDRMRWGASRLVQVHGARFNSTATDAFQISTAVDDAFVFLSNRLDGRFQPASMVVVSRCVLPSNATRDPKRGPAAGPPLGRNPWVLCEPRDRHPTPVTNPCILVEDEYMPYKFQHFYINSVPTYGLSALLKRFVFPSAQLVVEDPQRLGKYTSEGAEKYSLSVVDETTRCGAAADGSREWLIVGEGEEGHHAQHDCYPVGSYDWYRRTHSAKNPGSILLYASREGGGGRGPIHSDGDQLEVWLKNLADKLSLTYAKTRHNQDAATLQAQFKKTRVVFAPHGGALTNIVFSHASTLVVEIGSAHPGKGRFCFACMAFAMRFAGYAIFDAGTVYEGYAKVDHSLDVAALARFWDVQVAPLYDRVKGLI